APWRLDRRACMSVWGNRLEVYVLVCGRGATVLVLERIKHSRTATLFDISVSRPFPSARLSHHECPDIFRCYRQGCPFPCHPCSRLLRSIPCPCEFLFRFEGFDRYRPCP